MPAPNGPRQGISTGRNRRTVQNIASKGGNIRTALQRDRLTGLGGALNQAPKPATPAKKKTAYAPTESLKKQQAIRASSSLSLSPTTKPLGPADFSSTMGSSMAQVAAASASRANLTALALMALRRQGKQGGGSMPTASATGHLQQLAQRMAANRYGWDSNKQWKALQELVQRESSWNPKADNPTSTAYGLFQFLDSTRENYGIGLNASPRKQILAGLRYINDRYGGPRKALNFHTRNNWY